jgi:hypothetical protein
LLLVAVLDDEQTASKREIELEQRPAGGHLRELLLGIVTADVSHHFPGQFTGKCFRLGHVLQKHVGFEISAR